MGSRICGKIAVMVEPWTRERRLERTRSLLVDAAEQVFAEKGFVPATLDDIAKTAGYSKGAIYKYFATKEDLFLAVSDRYWRRYFDKFAEVISSADHIGARELEEIAERWRQLSHDRGAEHAALGLEFNLYLLRNPEARERVAAKRSEVVDELASTSSRASRSRRDPVDPCVTFAHIIIATTDAVELAATSRRRPLPADRRDVRVGRQDALTSHSLVRRARPSGTSAPSGSTSSPSWLI